MSASASSPPPPEGIDAGVWAELPEDIRREISRDAQQQRRAASPTTNSQIPLLPSADSSSHDLAQFFASLDPAARSQALLDTPSAQLLQMPPELRGEAEFLRFQHAFDMQHRLRLGASGSGGVPDFVSHQQQTRKLLCKEQLNSRPIPGLDSDLESAKWTLEQFSKKPSARLESLLTLYCLSPNSREFVADELLCRRPETMQLHEIKFLSHLIQAQADMRKRIVEQHNAQLFVLLSRVGQEKSKFKRAMDTTRAILMVMDSVLVDDPLPAGAGVALSNGGGKEEKMGLEALSRLLADEDCPDREFELAKKVAKKLAKRDSTRIDVLLGDLDATCEILAREVAEVSLKQVSVTLAEQRFLRVIKTVKTLRGGVTSTPELEQVWQALQESIKLSNVVAEAVIAPSPVPTASPAAGPNPPQLVLEEAAVAPPAAANDDDVVMQDVIPPTTLAEVIALQEANQVSDSDEEEEGGAEDSEEEDEDSSGVLHIPASFHGSHEMRTAFSQMMDVITSGNDGGDNRDDDDDDEDEDGQEEEEDEEDVDEDEDDDEDGGGRNGHHTWIRRLLPPMHHHHDHHLHFMHHHHHHHQQAKPASHSNASRYLCIIEAFFECNEDNESALERFGGKYSALINELVSEQPSLLTSSLECLVSRPGLRKVLNFDNKRAYFKIKMRQRHQAESRSALIRTRDLKLNIRRNHVFDDTYNQIGHKSAEELKGGISVTFHGEEAVDVGGPTKEWFTILIREMFKPGYALFKKSENAANAYQPDPRSSVAVGPDHLKLFKFAGRVIGKALSMNQLVDVHFTRSFYKHLLGGQVALSDLESLDMEYYKSLMKLLEMDDVDCLELHFTTDTEQFGVRQTVELKPNGSLVKVTEESKHEYIKLAAHHKMSISIQKQIDSFVEGFYDLVPKELIDMFTPQEMELLLSGTPTISIADLKKHTEYHGGYTAESKQVEWFWDVMHSFGQEQRAKFLMFVTGTSQVPLDGFANLSGMRGNIQRFSIHRGPTSDSTLPSSHTCFHQLILPQYPSKDVLREKLLLAVTECSEGFGFV